MDIDVLLIIFAIFLYFSNYWFIVGIYTRLSEIQRRLEDIEDDIDEIKRNRRK